MQIEFISLVGSGGGGVDVHVGFGKAMNFLKYNLGIVRSQSSILNADLMVDFLKVWVRIN